MQLQACPPPTKTNTFRKHPNMLGYVVTRHLHFRGSQALKVFMQLPEAHFQGSQATRIPRELGNMHFRGSQATQCISGVSKHAFIKLPGPKMHLGSFQKRTFTAARPHKMHLGAPKHAFSRLRVPKCLEKASQNAFRSFSIQNGFEGYASHYTRCYSTENAQHE